MLHHSAQPLTHQRIASMPHLIIFSLILVVGLMLVTCGT